MTDLECPACGGPIEVQQGDSFTVYSTHTVWPDGSIEEGGESRADWCPKCQREWEAKVDTEEGSGS